MSGLPIDTRNSYRAVPVKNQEYWSVQFRHWFSFRWHEIKWTCTLEDAQAVAIKHSEGDSRETVNFGRLPA